MQTLIDPLMRLVISISVAHKLFDPISDREGYAMIPEGKLRVKIVGSGLIGGSLALSLLQNGHQVSVSDKSAQNEKLALDLLGLSEEANSEFSETPDLVVIATPAESVFSVLLEQYQEHPESRFIDISGLKSNLLLEVARIPGLNSRFLGTHPMAGREVTGPESARADLFEGRAWIITPSLQTAPEFLELVRHLILSTGASVFERDPQVHDEQIALVSHLPQVISSLLGVALAEHEEEELALAGGGVRDISRLAASSPDLWSALLTMNSNEVLPLLESLKQSIDILVDRLERGDREGVREFLAIGNEGRAKIPGKHGGKLREYHLLPIVIDDKPGQLAKIFHECEVISVNVEDLTIEHSPGQQTGLITLALSQSDAEKLHAHLSAQGWLAHSPRSL
jgi:prephenate dehydrogenase